MGVDGLSIPLGNGSYQARWRGYTSASPFIGLTNLSAAFTASVRGYDAIDSRLLAVDTTNDQLKQSTDNGTTWSGTKTVPTNVTVNGGSNIGQIARFGNYLWLLAKDNTDSLWKVWRSSPQAGNTAFSWGSPLLAMVTGATAPQVNMAQDGVNLVVAEYGDPVGGPSAYKISLADANGAGTNWTTAYAQDATLRHIHCIAPDPYNAGHWWMTVGDGVAKTIQRSTDNLATWSVIVASSVWQGVQISFDPTYVYIAGDSQRGSLVAIDRATLTPRIGAKNRISMIAIPSATASKTWDPPSIADGAMTSTTVTLTGVSSGSAPFIVAALALNLPAGMQITAHVSAADTVTVTLVNHSGSVQDLASTTLKVSTVGGSFYENAYYGIVDPATGVYYAIANDTSVTGTRAGWFMLPHVGDYFALLDTYPNLNAGAAYIGGGFVFAGNYRHSLLVSD